MHNRARMVVAQFLVKDVHVPWTKGERFFAEHLVDYSPSQNAGNWQWNASLGTDPEVFGPRIFSPWAQSARFDPKAIYIKRWVPELADVDPGDIHRWASRAKDAVGYPPPMLDHAERRRGFLAMLGRKNA